MKYLFFILAISVINICSAQEPEKKTKADPSKPMLSNAERARSAVEKLNMKDKAKKEKVYEIVVLHLDSQKIVFNKRKKATDLANALTDKELADARAKAAWEQSVGNFNKLGAVFLGKLSTLLTLEESDLLKDQLTENGLKREYNNFLDLFPTLSELQKSQLMAYLREARDNAMNGETPENRVDWFIKFRGRANNYLSAAGYDLKKATADQKRRKGITD